MFRRGEVGGWVTEMPSVHKVLVWAIHGDAMSLLGYSMGESERPEPLLPADLSLSEIGRGHIARLASEKRALIELYEREIEKLRRRPDEPLASPPDDT
jgi:hypothetical protein